MAVQPGSTGHMLPRALVVSALAVEAGLAALLAGLHLGRQSLWLDEAVSAQLTRVPTRDFFTLITGREANSAAYFLLLRGWSRVAGDSASGLRSLSVVATALTVIGIYLVGTRLFGPASALAAALLYAVSPATVLAAQEARGFALETCVLVFSVAAFLMANERGGGRWWVVWSALTALAGWIHFLAMLVPVALVCSLVVLGSRARWRPALVALGAAVAAVVPLAYAGHRGGQGGLAFLRGATFENLRALPRSMGGGSWPLTAFFVVAVAAGVVLWVVRLRRGCTRGDAFPIALTTAWLVVPVLLGLAISVVKPVFSARYFHFELPPLVLLATSASRFVSRPVAAFALVVGLALSVVGVARVYSQAPTQDWRTATARVLAEARPGDRIVFAPTYARIPFIYYLAGSARKRGAPVSIVPADPWAPLPLEEFPLVRAAVDDPSALVAGRRVWVVGFSGFAFGASSPDASSVVDLLRNQGRVSREERFPGVMLRLYDAR